MPTRFVNKNKVHTFNNASTGVDRVVILRKSVYRIFPNVLDAIYFRVYRHC